MQLKRLLEIRTNNFTDPMMEEKFKLLWHNVSDSIPEKTTMYSVFSDYATDYMGDYTAAVFIEDEQAELEIPLHTKYEVFSVDATDKNGVADMWQRIWEQEDLGKINRAYTYDYEKYNSNGEISIHVAIL